MLSSAGVLGTIGLLTIGLTTAPQAVASASGRGTAAYAVETAAGGSDSSTASEDSEEVQSFIAPLSVQNDAMERSSYDAGSLAASELDLTSFLSSSVADASGTPAEGGLNLEQAQALIADYVSTSDTAPLRKGEAVLNALYPNGAGPSDCGSGGVVDRLDNCVSFVTYFMNVYTTFDQYVTANGGQEASTMAAMLQRSTSSTPSVYAIGSNSSTSYYGHTYVVLGIQGDQAIIGEAACGLGAAQGWPRARSVPLSSLSGNTFVNVSDLVMEQPRSLEELLSGQLSPVTN